MSLALTNIFWHLMAYCHSLSLASSYIVGSTGIQLCPLIFARLDRESLSANTSPRNTQFPSLWRPFSRMPRICHSNGAVLFSRDAASSRVMLYEECRTVSAGEGVKGQLLPVPQSSSLKSQRKAILQNIPRPSDSEQYLSILQSKSRWALLRKYHHKGQHSYGVQDYTRPTPVFFDQDTSKIMCEKWITRCRKCGQDPHSPNGIEACGRNCDEMTVKEKNDLNYYCCEHCYTSVISCYVG